MGRRDGIAINGKEMLEHATEYKNVEPLYQGTEDILYGSIPTNFQSQQCHRDRRGAGMHRTEGIGTECLKVRTGFL